MAFPQNTLYLLIVAFTFYYPCYFLHSLHSFAALKRYEKDNNFEVNMIKTDMSNLMNNVSTLDASLTVMKNDITIIDSSEINSAEFNSLKKTVRHLESSSKSDVSNIIRKIDSLSNSALEDAVVNELK